MSFIQPKVRSSQTFNACWPFNSRHESLSSKDFQEATRAGAAFYDSVLPLKLAFLFSRPSHHTIFRSSFIYRGHLLASGRCGIKARFRNIRAYFTFSSLDVRKSHFREKDAFSHPLFSLRVHGAKNNKKTCVHFIYLLNSTNRHQQWWWTCVDGVVVSPALCSERRHKLVWCWHIVV